MPNKHKPKTFINGYIKGFITIPFFILFVPLFLITILCVGITALYDWLVGNRFAYTEWHVPLIVATDNAWQWYLYM